LAPAKIRLPATITQADITADQRTRTLNVVLALIADLGDEAAWRYVEFEDRRLADLDHGAAGRRVVPSVTAPLDNENASCPPGAFQPLRLRPFYMR
jgi:hypothetical protein